MSKLEENEDGRTGEGAGLRGSLGRAARIFLRLTAFLMFAAGGVFAGGFVIFYEHVASLSAPEDPRADAIVVLTGGYQRIDQAVALLQKKAGKRLLISGVNPSTTANHIRRLTGGPLELFKCCVDIGHDARDTEGNAAETVNWIRANGFRTVILVTNNYHMPRSLAEIRRADVSTTFIPYPVEKGLTLQDLASNPLLIRTLASEYVKYLLVVSRDWTGIEL